MTWFGLPLFIWALNVTSLIFVLGTPVIAISTVSAGAREESFTSHLYPAVGGDPRSFSIFSGSDSTSGLCTAYPPAMGVISELITAFSRRKSSVTPLWHLQAFAIAIISFVVWGHQHVP